MKFNFKKISAIGASVLLTGMTMGGAFAVAPSDNAFDAVVYGASADASDLTQANSISSWLGLTSTSSSGTLSGDGDTYKIERPSTKFQIGNGIVDVRSTAITDDNMPFLLKDGTFVDNDNDEFGYTQKIELHNNSLALWDDNSYKADTPTLGFKIGSSTNVLNYTFDFSKNPNWLDLSSSDINFMGKTYYILSTNAGTNTSLTLLDSSETTLLAQGETVTVGGKVISVEYIGSNAVKLNVDGEITKSLAESDTYHLLSGEYVGIKEILYNAVQGSINKVEFSVGEGKLTLTHGQNVELNDDGIDGLSVEIGGQGSATITDIKLVWTTSDTEFITPDSEITMPGFGSVKLSYTGVTYPAEETIEVKNSGKTNIVLESFPLKDSTEDIEILEWDSTNHWFDLVGKDSDEKLLSSNATNVTFNALGSDRHKWFVVSWSDGSDAESYLMRASNFEISSAVEKCDFEYRKDGKWEKVKEDAILGDTFTLGNVEINVGSINNTYDTVEFARGNANMRFDVLYSKEGMKVFLPWTDANNVSINNATTYANDSVACAVKGATGNREIMSYITYNHSVNFDNEVGTCAQPTVSIVFSEEDKSDNIGEGANITVVLADRSGNQDEVDVRSVTISGAGYYHATTGLEIGSTDVLRNFVYSALGTEILNDIGPDQDTVKLIYHGSEVAADVYVTSEDVSAITTTGSMVFKDSETTSWNDKNVIIVGGTCINTAAATALGIASGTCGADFTSATGVNANEYMIKTVADKFTTDKIAMVVAGYEKADTVAGVTKLVNEGTDVEATAGKEYRGRTGVTGSLAFEEVA